MVTPPGKEARAEGFHLLLGAEHPFVVAIICAPLGRDQIQEIGAVAVGLCHARVDGDEVLAFVAAPVVGLPTECRAAGVLDGDFFVDAEGNMTEGAMPNRGAVAASIDGLSTLSYTIPAGYHDGTGTVSLTDDIERALAAI